jgi:hypothetical protein
VLQGQTQQKLFLVQQEALAEKMTEIEIKLKKKVSARKKEKLETRLERVNYRLEHPKLVFGGRKAWDDLKAGVITKEQWSKRRDGQIYCRGDKTQKGNLNIRIMPDDTLRITVGTRKWVSYKLFVPEKYHDRLKVLLVSGQAYNVRLKRKDDQHFKVMIDCQMDEPTPTSGIGFENGVLGVENNGAVRMKNSAHEYYNMIGSFAKGVSCESGVKTKQVVCV